MSRADDIESRAASFLLRSEEPGWSGTDQAELDQWLAESMANRASYLRLAEAWRQVDRLASTGRLASPTTKSAYWRPWYYPAVAATAICLISWGVVGIKEPVRSPSSVATTYATTIGARKQVPFADGSKVELNTATEMRARVGANGRDVWLDHGEAFFEVAHDPSRPFIVHAGPRAVTVLGTKFAVRRERGRITVSVLEGRVRVDDARSQTSDTHVTVSPGDVVLAEGASTLVTNESIREIESRLAWRRGVIQFDRGTLDEVAAEFNRYNRKRLIITDNRAKAIRIGGTFQATNVDAFARLLHVAFHLDVHETNDEIRISGHKTTDF